MHSRFSNNRNFIWFQFPISPHFFKFLQAVKTPLICETEFFRDVMSNKSCFWFEVLSFESCLCDLLFGGFGMLRVLSLRFKFTWSCHSFRCFTLWFVSLYIAESLLFVLRDARCCVVAVGGEGVGASNCGLVSVPKLFCLSQQAEFGRKLCGSGQQTYKCFIYQCKYLVSTS